MEGSASSRYPHPPDPRPGASYRAEGFQLTDLLDVLKLRKRLIVVFTAVMVTGSILRHVLYVPTFSASATLVIQKAEDSPLQMALANLGASEFDSRERMTQYLNYMQSGDFHLAVAEALKFKEGYNLLNLTPPGEMALLKKNFWVHFIRTRLGKEIHTTDASVTPEPYLVPVEALAGILGGMIAVERTGADTLVVAVTTLDAFTSMVLANTLVEVFRSKTSERDYNEVTEVKAFIQDQLAQTTERLKASELALVEFKKKHNIISISNEQASIAARLNGLDRDLETARIELQQNEKLIKSYEEQLTRTEKSILEEGSASIKTSPASYVSALRKELDSLRYKKVLMQSQGYADDSWQMKEVDGEIDRVANELKSRLKEAGPEGGEESAIDQDQVRARVAALKERNKELTARIQTVEKSKGDLSVSVTKLPKDEQVLLELDRDTKLQFELYSTLRKKLQEIEIQQVALRSHILIAQRASLPGPAPRASLLLKIIFALLVGSFLGGIVALLLEAVDPTVKYRADLEEMEFVTLGSIPHVEGSVIRRNLGGHSYRPDLLVCKEKPESPESMAFKHVRAQLTNLRGTDGRAAKIVIVTSPERGDGKTFVAANLAVSLAQLEKKTLLVDCDFRNPSLPWLFGYRSGDGISSLLGLKTSLEEIVIRDWMPNLDIIPAGWTPENPTELLSNEKFRILLEHLRGIYDHVVIDSPPAIAVVDASVLANLGDVVIMTASFRKTKKDAVLQALKKILQVTHKQVYAILNNVGEVHEYGYYVYPHRDAKARLRPESMDSRGELVKFEQSLKKRKAG